MRRELRAIYDSSDFARENLSFYETLLLIFEKWGVPREALYLESKIEDSSLLKIKEDLKRAVSGEPLGYILGKIPFFEEEYFIEEGVLIPRRDSEVVVLTAIENLKKDARFLDICTGSGCLAISTLKKRVDTRGVLLDVSEKAVALSKKNALNMGVADRCRVERFDLFQDDISSFGDYDAIIMNPPYITKSEMLTLPENVKREPALALDGGVDGLDFYRAIAGRVPKDKTLIFEIGASQGDALLDIFGEGEIIKDLSGCDRVFLRKVK